ncbi:hypothetical protein B0H67DRAFT_566849 [Lasiosphaeris hirsuta]|uniref:NmrA-like domain-containing protein n=1 Tax=Lasiosphaeris hirsuta TaxID=260670 RepID=A0AA40E9W3_9PEZI|nr:hypothetical protein B0H67DRAFT_566849 [Lasiosphaeris hirsuta]
MPITPYGFPLSRPRPIYTRHTQLAFLGYHNIQQLLRLELQQSSALTILSVVQAASIGAISLQSIIFEPFHRLLPRVVQMGPSRKTVLVTGATGKQGGALIQHLLQANQDTDTTAFNIIALTRDVTSTRALKLGAHFNVSVVGGDMSEPEAVFQKVGPVWGVYSVQVNSNDEEAQGVAWVDAAVAHDVRHFVYSSGDRGGPEKSAVTPTDVKNFAAKFRIEKHLEERAASSPQQMTYTILRPVTFFENLTADVHGKGFARMWEQMGDKTLQFVSTQDIGWFAANAFLRPSDFRNVAVTLVGDELTQAEADVLFKAAVGLPMPLAPCPVASAVKFFLRGTVGDMFRWFEKEGYGGDVAFCRQLQPGMMDFKAWITANKGQFSD